MNLRESYYVSSNSHYNISYIYLHKIPCSTPRSPPTHLQKQLVSFLSCCKGHTRTKGKQKNTILRDQLKLNQKCSQQHSVSSPLFDIIPILKLLHLLHLQKLPQKNFAPCHQDEASQVGHSNIGAFPGTQHHCLVVPLQTRPWQTGPWRIRQEARANEMSQLRAASRDGTGTSDSPIV